MKIDNSQLQTFISCPYKYYNKFIRKIKKVKLDESTMYLNWGKGIHTALEVYYKGGTPAQAIDVFSTTFIPTDGDTVRTTTHGCLMLQEYFKYYSGTTNELGDKNFKVIQVEYKDSFVIRDSVEWLVKMDLIVENNAGIWVVDHKTTTKTLYSFISSLTPNMQVSGYTDFVQREMGQCSGFIPNVLCYGFRKKAYKDEPAGFHWIPQRDIVNRTKDQLEDFENQVIYWCEKLTRSLEEMVWGKNENNCRYCEYKDLCTSCDDENVMNVMYEKVENPLAYLDGVEE